MNFGSHVGAWDLVGQGGNFKTRLVRDDRVREDVSARGKRAGFGVWCLCFEVWGLGLGI